MKSWILGGALFCGGMLVGAVGLSSAQADHQPMMKKALKNLEQARNDLQAAQDDKGGHRVNAKRLVDQAIDEVQKGIAFDNKH